MVNKKRIEDKERILRHLFRKGSLQNTYKVARELGMERLQVLDILHELGEEGKVKLMHGSVKAITRELSEEENIKTKSEVEELKEKAEKLEKNIEFTFNLKERVEKLEKKIDLTFSRLREAIPAEHKKASKEIQSKEGSPENTKI